MHFLKVWWSSLAEEAHNYWNGWPFWLASIKGSSMDQREEEKRKRQIISLNSSGENPFVVVLHFSCYHIVGVPSCNSSLINDMSSLLNILTNRGYQFIFSRNWKSHHLLSFTNFQSRSQLWRKKSYINKKKPLDWLKSILTKKKAKIISWLMSFHQ